MGLSSAGYYGHIFWDADIFMFPALAVLHPELAEPMVEFRSKTLDAARENAKQNGYRGAMYPWEAGPAGHEATPRFAAQNASSENHVNGDVALASWQYWLATGDRDWLRNDCWPILRDTADFWVSRVNFDNRRGRYEISHVVAVNESEIGVSNDPYTNAIAKKNLQLALAAAALLHLSPHSKWREIADKMYLPDSDSALLWYPLDESFPPSKTHQAIQTMISEVQHDQQGAMMGTEFYPILAAEVRDRSAIGVLLWPLLTPYLRAPFQVVAETPRNQNTNFITGAGAFLQQFVFGYTGLRFGQDGLIKKYQSALPPGINRLTLRNISVHGKRETLVFTSPR
jgi:trehalose/maltose hydrolase-like predicted phosphorylase